VKSGSDLADTDNDLFSGDFTKINIAPGDEGGQLDSGTNTPNGAQMFVSDDNQAASSWVVSPTALPLIRAAGSGWC